MAPRNVKPKDQDETIPDVVEEAPMEEASITEPTAEAAAPVEVIAAPTVCGHANLQHYGLHGKLEKITCDLKPGHASDHHAKYMKNIGESVHDEKGRVVSTTYHQEEKDAWWNDAAGKPARPNDGLEVAQISLLQKDLIMQIMSKNPNLTVEQALAQAKANPAWNIANEPG